MLCLFVWLVGFLTSSSTTRLYRGRAPRQERLTILRAATHETELGDHDFCLSRSHYTLTMQKIQFKTSEQHSLSVAINNLQDINANMGIPRIRGLSTML